MNAQAIERPVAGLIGDVDHWYCCDPTRAYCGTDLAGVPEGREFPDMCPACVRADGTEAACPGCAGQPEESS